MRIKLNFAICLALALALSAGCVKKSAEMADHRRAKKAFKKYGPIESAGAKRGHEELDIPYAMNVTGHEELTLDVYWNDHDGQIPVVINVHGGAWEVGDKRAPNSLFRSRYMANRGFVAVSVNYRMLPDYPIQTQVEDVMAAVIWVKENIAKYGGDPDRVGIMGGSAGGHLASMVAWASDDPYFKPTDKQNSTLDSDVKAAVLFYGVYDLESMLALHRPQLTIKQYVKWYGLKTRDDKEIEEILKHVSPKNQVDEKDPPSYFICGDEDGFDLYKDSLQMSQKLVDLGLPTGLYTAKGAGHGFDTMHGEKYTQEAMEATVEWFNKYL